MDAGWSTITRTVPNLLISLSKTALSCGSPFGRGLSKTFFPTGMSPWPWCVLLPTSKPRKTPTPPMSITVPPHASMRADLGGGAVRAHPRYADLPPANGRALRRAKRRSNL